MYERCKAPRATKKQISHVRTSPRPQTNLLLFNFVPLKADCQQNTFVYSLCFLYWFCLSHLFIKKRQSIAANIQVFAYPVDIIYKRWCSSFNGIALHCDVMSLLSTMRNKLYMHSKHVQWYQDGSHKDVNAGSTNYLHLHLHLHLYGLQKVFCNRSSFFSRRWGTFPTLSNEENDEETVWLHGG